MHKLKSTAIFTYFVMAVASLFVSTAAAQQPSPSEALPFTLKPLGHNVYAAINGPKGEAGANAGFFIGETGVLVVDSFQAVDAAKKLLAEIHKLTPLPVKYVVNTHYHLDHTAGNRVFQDAGAAVIAHRNVPAWIHTENLKFFGKEITPIQKSMVESIGTPDIVYDQRVEAVLGSTTVLIRYFPGHTGGDSVVFIPSADVVFGGDLFWNQTLPNLIDASTAPWIETLDQVGKHHPSAAFVPGHGDVGKASDVEAFRDYLQDIRNMTQALAKTAHAGDDVANELMPALDQKYGKWNFFKYFARRNLLDTVAEWRGTKKIPTPLPAD